MSQTVLAVAHAILDGIADTFRCVFYLPWTPCEVSHTHLTATFLHFCAAHRLTGDTDALYARMRALRICLRTYRFPLGAVALSRETLRQVVTEFEQYLIGMLDFFACNLPHPVLGSDTRTARYFPAWHATRGRAGCTGAIRRRGHTTHAAAGGMTEAMTRDSGAQHKDAR